MKRILYISFYIWLGLYIAWDSTMLLDFKPYFSTKTRPNNRQLEYDRQYNPQLFHSENNDKGQLGIYQTAVNQISLMDNKQNIIPFMDLDTSRFYLLTLGPELPVFEEYLSYYTEVLTDEVVSVAETNPNYLGYFNPIILAINGEVEDSITQEFVERLEKKTQVVIVNFRSLEVLDQLERTSNWLQVYNNDPLSQAIAAQILFGGIKARGVVPMLTGLDELEEVGDTTTVTRLSYGFPELVGIDSRKLSMIDSIVWEGIADSAMPGCQVLLAKNGKVIYHKGFGSHTYKNERPTQLTDLYDIASITKVAATTLASMKLYDSGDLKLNQSLRRYFRYQLMPESIKVWDTLGYNELITQIEASPSPVVLNEDDTIRYKNDQILVGRWESKGNPRVPAIFDVTPLELLTHTSGLQPSLSLSGFYNFAQKTSSNPNFTYSSTRSTYFMDYTKETGEIVWRATMQLPLGSSQYRYSDVNMMLMRRLIDSLTQQKFSLYLNDQFYQKMGLQYLCFNPLDKFDKDQIVPTEYNAKLDTLIHGVVHDPIAALMGGEAGHAGLFSNANDLAVIFQMLLNGGSYGGRQYIQPETIKKFTTTHGYSRGLGFDKPPLDRPYIIARSASEETFGHTGFTGTCVWADPENDIIFVFLSNRVYPSAKNRRIHVLRIRERIHQVVYDALGIPPRKYERRSTYPTYFTKADNNEESENPLDLGDAR